MWLLSLAEMMICFGTISDCSVLICDASESERPALFILAFYPGIWGKGPWPQLGKISTKMLNLGCVCVWGGGSQPKVNYLEQNIYPHCQGN